MAQAPVTASCPERIAQLFAGKHVDAVCFDVDSTICTTEGIDEFAAFLNVGDAVAAVTRKAMEGAMDFRTALASRLSAMQITREKLDEFITQHPPILTPGAASLVAALRARGIAVYLVSGGFRPLIAPAAAELGLDPSAHVVANSFVFPPSGGGAAAADTGAFATFDTNEPTSSSGGKARALEAIIAANGYKTVLMVGDGATGMDTLHDVFQVHLYARHTVCIIFSFAYSSFFCVCGFCARRPRGAPARGCRNWLWRHR